MAMVSASAGATLHVRERPGYLVPFLLVHGLSSNARLWDGVAEALHAAGHRTIAIDLRSHGESPTPEDGYDTATAAEDVAAVAHHLGVDRAIAVGQSWGGNVVVNLAAKHQDLVAGVGLVDGGWFDMVGRFGTWEACETALRPPDMVGVRVEQLRKWLRDGHPDWADWAVEATIGNLHVAPDGTLTRRLSVPHHMTIVRSMWDDPPAPHFADVLAPALLMPAVPDGDDWPQRSVVDHAAALLPDAVLRPYVGADHDLHAQHPRRVAEDLLDLVRRAGA